MSLACSSEERKYNGLKMLSDVLEEDEVGQLGRKQEPGLTGQMSI